MTTGELMGNQTRNCEVRMHFTEEAAARAIRAVLPDSRWVGATLSQAYLWLLENSRSLEDAARYLYDRGSFSLTRAREILPSLVEKGFLSHIKKRTKTGSAENPITKLFPAAITEQRFLERVDELRSLRASLDYEDDRYSGHSLVDFTLKEGDTRLAINVKNAGTKFERARQLVGLEPDDCIPIPVYKAYDAIEKEPNLLYTVAIDYELSKSVNRHLVSLFSKNEAIVWRILNDYVGTRIRDAEDAFVYGMTSRHWDRIRREFSDPDFRVISARKAVRILQKEPKRTPGIGLRAWGTIASAEINVHVSVAAETKSWGEILDRIVSKGLKDIVSAINRKKTEVVYDPEI